MPQTATPAPTQTPTPLPTTPAPASTAQALILTWNNAIGVIFQIKCGACHGASAFGGLNLSTYNDALKGGNSGAVIIPNDAANSLLVIKQQAGGHPGQLSADDVARIIEWINSGALEK